MIQEIAEKIRQQLDTIDWITRTGGLTIPLEILDGETQKTIPACRRYDDAPCDTDDYVNLAPDASEACIAFIEMPDDFQIIGNRSRMKEASLNFRVVLWYDTRKITFSGDVDPSWKMIDQIVRTVKAADINTGAIMRAEVRFSSMQFTPAQIWGRYNMRTENQGLFMYPYHTFGLNFNIICFINTKCIEGNLAIDANAC